LSTTLKQTLEAPVKQASFRISGLDCAECATALEKTLASLPGVSRAQIEFATARLRVEYQPPAGDRDIIRSVETSGYGAVPIVSGQSVNDSRPFLARNRRALLTAVSGLALATGFGLNFLVQSPLFVQMIFGLAIVAGGYPVVRSGLYGLWKNRSLDMNILMTIAVIGAIAIGEWEEGATVFFLFALGNTLEGYTMDRARGAIQALMSLAPRQASIKRGEVESIISVEEVQVGDVVVVRPGERIPVDGVVRSGASSVNQAPITGEAMPVEKGPGAPVYAGSINQQGYLEIESNKPYAENTIAKIMQIVEEAQSQRAPTQRFVDRFAHYYTPAVLAGAVAIVLIPWLVFGQPFHTWFYRALVLLVIACPCALVISTPVSIVSGIARAARMGVLIKGGVYLEEAGRLRVVAFDKTGTLTTGRPQVTDVIPLPTRPGTQMLPPAEVLHLAAAVEARSEHPLAAAVLHRMEIEKSHGQSSDDLAHNHTVGDFEAIIGRGAKAEVDGTMCYVGSARLFEEMGWPLDGVGDRLHALQSEGKTALLVGIGRNLVGIIALADTIRPGARQAVAALKNAGIHRVALLTGDHEQTAQAVAKAIGADEYQAGLLPEDKVAAIRNLLQKHGQVAMVGDGVNDAPALATATVGIAMGAAGTDIALETADIALMSDDLSKVASAISLSRYTLSVIRQNITLALGIKAIFLLLAVMGIATLWLAILADMGASLLVTANGMRILGFKDRNVG
jgi:Cd2+/Zn2+-exporting ATPase